jgi:NAD(P)-dependent dehydrogenase (short-subunit alcohol dehydrogenase family)
MTKLLDGRTAVITGGSEGIGFATAARFVDEGARVVIAARRQEQLDSAVAQLGHRAIGVRTDVASPTELDELFAVVAAKFGHLDILVANASIAQAVPLGEFTEQHIDDTLAINVKSMAFTVQKALPFLVSGSSIILTSSSDNQTGGPGRSLYAASKAAERNLARSWTVELADRGVRVNVVSPGPTLTGGLAGLVGAGSTAELNAAMGGAFARGSLITPEEVANAIVFLGSSLSSGVSGIELPVDAGFAQVR